MSAYLEFVEESKWYEVGRKRDVIDNAEEEVIALNLSSGDC
jgi:hypothetical protein